jgi:hypothetical protein
LRNDFSTDEASCTSDDDFHFGEKHGRGVPLRSDVVPCCLKQGHFRARKKKTEAGVTSAQERIRSRQAGRGSPSDQERNKI